MRTGEFDHILAVQNPIASQAARAERVIGQLMDSRWGSGLDVLQTRPPAEFDIVQDIQERLRPGTLVMSFGGDGLLHGVFNAIVRAQSDGRVDAGEVGLIGMPTGNGNDYSLSVYQGNILRRRRLYDILQRQETTWVDGMKLEVGDRPERVAHSHTTFGFVARSAEYINFDDYRARRRENIWVPGKLSDTKQVLKALRGLQPVEYMNGTGEVRTVQEIIYTLRRRIAAGVIMIDTDPFDREIARLELPEEAFVKNALKVVCLQRFGGGAKAETVESPQEFTVLTPTPWQYDGEPDLIPGGTPVKISHIREAVRVLV